MISEHDNAFTSKPFLDLSLAFAPSFLFFWKHRIKSIIALTTHYKLYCNEAYFTTPIGSTDRRIFFLLVKTDSIFLCLIHVDFDVKINFFPFTRHCRNFSRFRNGVFSRDSKTYHSDLTNTLWNLKYFTLASRQTNLHHHSLQIETIFCKIEIFCRVSVKKLNHRYSCRIIPVDKFVHFLIGIHHYCQSYNEVDNTSKVGFKRRIAIE